MSAERCSRLGCKLPGWCRGSFSRQIFISRGPPLENRLLQKRAESTAKGFAVFFFSTILPFIFYDGEGSGTAPVPGRTGRAAQEVGATPELPRGDFYHERSAKLLS